MSNRIIIPKYNVDLNNEPVIFLAGPVRNGGGWQKDALRIIRSKNSNVYIAIPDYANILGDEILSNSKKSLEFFHSQLEWEQNYLEIAENKGAILFWLPKQIGEMPISKESGFIKPYAQDTRSETGGWGWGLLRCKPKAHITIGGQEGYSGLSVTKRNFTKYAPHIPFRDNLEQVCEDALGFLCP
jgi:hypothetical protein